MDKRNPASTGNWVNIDKLRIGRLAANTGAYLQCDSYTETRQFDIVLDAKNLNDNTQILTIAMAKRKGWLL